jgi:hypothetical protein
VTPRSGDAVDLGDPVDREQFLGQRLHATRFDVQQHERGDHARGYPFAAPVTSV